MRGESRMVKIGERVKYLRAKRKLTQERLAVILGVSPQAISRWENGTTYPDINMLPSIARYFDVSVDELLGMDELRNEEEIALIHSRVHELVEAGDVKEAVVHLREALRKYPNDDGFMSELALALSLYQDYNVSTSELEEAILISEGILNDCREDKIRSTIRANLCFVYLKSGNDTLAYKLAKTLPHVWESREMLLPEIHQSGLDDHVLREGIAMNIDVMYTKIMSLAQKNTHCLSKMLMLGPSNCENVSFDEKLKVIAEYLKQ